MGAEVRRVAALRELERYDEAERQARTALVGAARHAVALAPSGLRIRPDPVLGLRAAGQRLEALARGAPRGRAGPELARAHRRLAELHSARNDRNGARRAYRHAPRLDPTGALSRQGLAHLEWRWTRPGRALRGLIEAGEMDPTDLGTAQLGAGLILGSTGVLAGGTLGPPRRRDPVVLLVVTRRFPMLWLPTAGLAVCLVLTSTALVTGELLYLLQVLLVTVFGSLFVTGLPGAPGRAVAGATVSGAAERVARLRELKRYAEAEREARTALAADPHQPGVLAGLAAVLLDAGRHSDGLVAAAAAAAADPDSEWPHRLRALLLSELGRHEEAVAAGYRAVTLEPEDAHAAIGYSTVLEEAGRLDEAREVAVHAVRLAPHMKGAHFRLGRVSSASGDVTTARQAYQEVLRLDPANAAARNNLAALDMGTDRFTDALRGLLDAGSLDPSLTVVMDNIVLLMRRLCLRLGWWLGGAALISVMVSGYHSGGPIRMAAVLMLVIGAVVCVCATRNLPAATRPAVRAALHVDTGLRLCYLGLAGGVLVDLTAAVTGLPGLLVAVAVIALAVLSVRVTDGIDTT
jgi:tetratricopeptide (TPR) repeat protein